MHDDFDTERRATLIKEAQAITAALKSEIVELGTQLGRVLDGCQGDGDDDGDPGPSEAREERLATVAAVANDVGARKGSWRFWR